MSMFDLNGKKWTVILPLCVLAGIGGVVWGLNRVAISFGMPPHGELIPKVVHRGDRVDVVYDSIYWYRVWPSTITQWYECMVREPATGVLFKMRFDLQQRIVPIPPSAGPLPHKTRPIANQQDVPYPVPYACENGPLIYGGYIRVHTLWGAWPLDYPLPPNMVAEVQS